MSQHPRPSRNIRRLCYEQFRSAAGDDACCAGAGGDIATTLATLMARGLTETRPAEALDDLLSQQPGAPVHGVWHHALVGELLLVCLRNAGYRISDDLIDEVLDRGRQIPGGSCGFLGACGALSSAASAYAILLGSTPVATEPRNALLAFSARLASRLSEIGGSRCCKKSSYVALEGARQELAKLGFELPEELFKGRCRFLAANDTCDGESCPYFPPKAASVAAAQLPGAATAVPGRSAGSRPPRGEYYPACLCEDGGGDPVPVERLR